MKAEMVAMYALRTAGAPGSKEAGLVARESAWADGRSVWQNVTRDRYRTILDLAAESGHTTDVTP